MSKSINVLFGEELKDLGYKKSSVNHFEKKSGKYILNVDRDLGDCLLLRLRIENYFNETKCIESKFIENISSFSPHEFFRLIIEVEKEFKLL
jgi:hypothetical protein